MNKQQSNQLARRRNHQQLKAHEFRTPTSTTTTQPVTRSNSQTLIKPEPPQHIKRYKDMTRKERQEAEEYLIQLNRYRQAILNDAYPDAWRFE